MAAMMALASNDVAGGGDDFPPFLLSPFFDLDGAGGEDAALVALIGGLIGFFFAAMIIGWW